MRKFWQRLSAAVVAARGRAPRRGHGARTAAGVAQNGVVGAVPGANTPQILDGTVLRHPAGRQPDRGRRQLHPGPAVTRPNGGAGGEPADVFAFDPTTGADRHRPSTRSSPAATTSMSARSRPGRTTPSTSAASSTPSTGRPGPACAGSCSCRWPPATASPRFTAPNINVGVNDLALVGNRLFVGGVFRPWPAASRTAASSRSTPTTGARTTYMGVDVTRATTTGPTAAASGRCTPGSGRRRQVRHLARRHPDDRHRQLPAGRRARARPGGHDRPAARPPPRSARTGGPGAYESTCYFWAFDSYVRDVAVLARRLATSRSRPPAAATPARCATRSTRWETTATGDDVQPTWAAYTGGDSLFSVEITGTAIYTGGHQRWMNNDLGRDFAAAGAVPRPGISAHDPRTGVPLAWNPGRHPRGVGAEAMLATADRPLRRHGHALHRQPPVPAARAGVLPARRRRGAAVGEHRRAAGQRLPGRAAERRARRRTPARSSSASTPVVRRCPANDGGPVWTADQGDDNPLRGPGRRSSHAWGPLATIDGTVPSSTPGGGLRRRARRPSVRRWSRRPRGPSRWRPARRSTSGSTSPTATRRRRSSRAACSTSGSRARRG